MLEGINPSKIYCISNEDIGEREKLSIKTLRGPRRPRVMCNEQYAQDVGKGSAPEIQEAFHSHTTAAVAVEPREYVEQS